MATLPSASLTIDEAAGSALSGGTGFAVVFACVQKNADSTPRVFSSVSALIAQHGYSPAVDYVASHIQQTRKPVILIGMPTVTSGVIGRVNSTGVLGTSAVSVAAGAAGYLEETDFSFTVVDGGTIGTNGITADISADGGWTTKRIRLGTATSYTVPYLGIIISFAAGTLVAGDVYTFTTTAPMWDATGLTAAREALATQQKLARSFVIVGDLANSTFAGYVVTEANAYETSNERFVYARANVRDRLPRAVAAKLQVRMSGLPNVTFAEVGATGDTITRAAGSFVTDGFSAGMSIDVSGSASNNFTKAKITAVSATVLTLDTQDLTPEGPVANVAIVGSAGLTFAEVGSTGDTITRSAGSWLDDGFRVGDKIVVTGSASNNITAVAGIATLTATVLTLGVDDLAAEFIGTKDVTIQTGETMASWISAVDAAFTSIDGEKRVDLAAGRARMLSPITGWSFRRPSMWHASIREHQHDVQIPCWRKSDNPLTNCDMTDGSGQVVEFDERSDGGGLAGRFTCLRTYANGPNGAFVALSLTRDTEGALLSRTHNLAVANVACTVVQTETENAIGQVLVLNDDGTGTDKSLQKIEERVNTQLQKNLLQQGIEGQRASKAVWSASRTDSLSSPGSILTGVLVLNLNGTLEQIATRVAVS